MFFYLFEAFTLTEYVWKWSFGPFASQTMLEELRSELLPTTYKMLATTNDFFFFRTLLKKKKEKKKRCNLSSRLTHFVLLVCCCFCRVFLLYNVKLCALIIVGSHLGVYMVVIQLGLTRCFMKIHSLINVWLDFYCFHL